MSPAELHEKTQKEKSLEIIWVRFPKRLACGKKKRG